MTEQNGVGRSSATDELRRLLDERGVEHADYGGKGHEDEIGRPATWWSSEQGEGAAIQRDDDLLTVKVNLTPEQAVAATLGAGECVMEYGGDVAEGTARAMGVYFCSECGSPNYNDCMPYYCIYCGKAVKR